MIRKFLLGYILITVIACAWAEASITPAFNQRLAVSSGGEHITAMVWLKESLSNKIYQKGILRPSAASFKLAARQSQQSIIEILQNARQTSEVSEYESFWIVNAIKVTASSAFFESIANRDDIKKIDLDHKIHLPKPVEGQITTAKQLIPAATQSNLSQISVDTVWNNYRVNSTQLLGSSIKVAIIDTGIDYNHTLLSSNIVAQYDFAENDADAFDDTSGHGTHVAGIVAAGDGIGVAPSASLLIARVFDDNDVGEISDLSSAAQWSIDNGARVINMSLGEETPGANTDMLSIINNIYNMGIVPVAAIGNQGPGDATTTSPGNCPNAIGVGAVDGSNTIASFSSRGPISWDGTSYTKPDVSGPGVSIYSTKPAYQSNYGVLSGTSQATPHVAGVIALMLQANSTLGNSEIKQILKNTADDLGNPGEDNIYGSGVINAIDALYLTDQSLPQVTHYQLTRANSNANIVITANIEDNVTLVVGQSIYGSIFYREDNGSWSSIAMTRLSGDRYFAYVPSSNAAKVDYYLNIRDLNPNNNVRLPSTGTYTVILRDEEAPQITHQQTDYYAIGHDITLTANVVDALDSAPIATVYYRQENAGSWSSLNMTDTGGNNFSASLPGVQNTGVTINYYIEARDSNNNNSYLPQNAPSTYYSIIEDKVIPSANLTLYENDILISKLISFEAYDNLAITAVTVTVDSGLLNTQNITISGNSVQIDLTGYSDGTHTIAISITDTNGNQKKYPEVSIILGSSQRLQILGPTAADSTAINYPNPFNPGIETTKIAFRITKPSDIEVALFNINMQRINTLTEVDRFSGLYYEIEWDGKDDSETIVPNGVYFYILKAEAQDDSGTVVVKGKIAVLR
ncbi:S8 family serine peptidase [Candidatus Margulisiibacteriota bacterium]